MSAEEAKKLISEGLAKLQEGLNQLCEIVDGLETADEDNPPSRFKRPQMPTNGFRENYTVQQIAERWQVSDDTVRNTFFNEPRVLKIGGPSRLAGRPQEKAHPPLVSLAHPGERSRARREPLNEQGATAGRHRRKRRRFPDGELTPGTARSEQLRTAASRAAKKTRLRFRFAD
jgi:hypothetical protein